MGSDQGADARRDGLLSASGWVGMLVYPGIGRTRTVA